MNNAIIEIAITLWVMAIVGGVLAFAWAHQTPTQKEYILWKVDTKHNEKVYHLGSFLFGRDIYLAKRHKNPFSETFLKQYNLNQLIVKKKW